LGSLFAALQFFAASSTVPPVARQESRQAQEKTQVPTDKRAVTRPQITAEKADKVPRNKVIETVRPPELLRPPAAEANAKDETVRGVGRIKDVEEPRRVHIVYFRQGTREWTERYSLDKNGKVINHDVQREDGPPTARPAADTAPRTPATPPAIAPKRL